MTGVDPVLAHCDTMAGPVIADAQKALAAKDVTPVLKWVKLEDEPVIKETFRKTLAARTGSKEAGEVADAHFFETLVRIHRAGEGEPFTGIKPATAVDPGLEMADQALEKGDADEVSTELSNGMAEKIHHLYTRALETQRHKDESVEAGRAFVKAYVAYIHFVERVHAMVAETGDAHGTEPEVHGH
ncbi:MAG: hypothetical protein HY851_07470 [candidate division Zixibacteria bacterium]|nr:hypothetical protein [candidate division Zixibacteria bacterium]